MVVPCTARSERAEEEKLNIKKNKFEFMNLLKILILLRVVPKMLTRKECSRMFNCYQDYVNKLE